MDNLYVCVFPFFYLFCMKIKGYPLTHKHLTVLLPCSMKNYRCEVQLRLVLGSYCFIAHVA